RLREAAPAGRPTGYGLVPELQPELPETSSEPWENCFDLAELEDWVKREKTGVEALRSELAAGTLAAGPAVDRYLIARENWSRIDQHVAYHQMWQRAASDNEPFFRARNALLADYRLSRT